MRLIAALLLTLVSIHAEVIPREEYRARRAELRRSLDGVMVLIGNRESDDLRQDYLQETNFLYLTGWKEPNAVLMLTRDEEILFLPPRDAHLELFMGRRIAPDDSDAAQRIGVDKVLSRSAMESTFLRLSATSEHVYTLPGQIEAEKLAALTPLHERSAAQPLISKLRMMKSPAEIELLTKASEATVEAHLAAWKMIKADEYEYEVAGAMMGAYRAHGCEGNAYSPIVGSGPNSIILHYSANRRRMDSGEVLLMDVGAECGDYASDVTRTVPVTGKFTPRQKEIYEVVLGAQKAAIAAIKPGMKIRGEKSLQQIAMDYINSHGKDLHGETLGKYFIHGLSHHVGLDVHDPSDPNATLKAGMVITIEPGIYIPEENIGVRIEDTVLVTENGSKNLSGALPREVSEIEKLVAK